MDWKLEISRVIYWKQIIADNDRLRAYPWHLPRVGAKPEEIALAEKAAGMEFSPEYKEFLSYADGWQGFVITVDLFGTKEFLEGRTRKVLERTELATFLKANSLSEDDVVPIGASDF